MHIAMHIERFDAAIVTFCLLAAYCLRHIFIRNDPSAAYVVDVCLLLVMLLLDVYFSPDIIIPTEFHSPLLAALH